MKRGVVAIASAVLLVAAVGGFVYLRESKQARIASLEAQADQLLAGGNFAQVLELAKAIENEEPLHPRAPIIAARAHLGTGNVQSATQSWKVATERDASSAEAAEGYGHVLALNGDFTNARIFLERAGALDAERLTVVARLAQIDVMQGQPEESVKRMVAMRAKRKDAAVDQLIREHVGLLRTANRPAEAQALENALQQ